MMRTRIHIRAQQKNDMGSRIGAFTSNVQGRVQVFRKKLEDARGPVAKDNVNKFIAIAAADTKFVSDFVKDLDQFHKDVFETIKSSPQPEHVVVEVVDAEENVFK